MAKEMLDLFIEELRDAYSAEKLASRSMPRVMKKLQHAGLRQAFKAHIEETQHQIERLEQVFEELEMSARAKTCHAMQGLIEEQKEVFDMDLEPELLDAALLAAQQKAEHYEIAAYGSLAAFARALGIERAAELLHDTLEEERRFDERLTELAEHEINPAALTYEEEEGDEEEEEGGEEEEEEEEEQLEVKGRRRGGARSASRSRGAGTARSGRTASGGQRGRRNSRTSARSRRAAE
jgi:ferritin-like metal-binding protein YciE